MHLSKFDDTVETVNSEIPEVDGTTHAKTTHMVTEETLTLWEFLQAWASDRKCQAATPIVRLSTLLSTYDRDCDLIQQSSVDGALQKYVTVA